MLVQNSQEYFEWYIKTKDDKSFYINEKLDGHIYILILLTQLQFIKIEMQSMRWILMEGIDCILQGNTECHYWFAVLVRQRNIQ